jgi:hypothetical protein
LSQEKALEISQELNNKIFSFDQDQDTKIICETNMGSNQDNYLLGNNEKCTIYQSLTNQNKKNADLENENKELIDIIFMDEEEKSKSELSKITEVDFSNKQFSQDKYTNSIINSNFENEKLNDQINKSSNKPFNENPQVEIYKQNAALLLSSSESIDFTKSNNNSVRENMDYSLDEKTLNSIMEMNPITKIHLKPKKHKPKSRSLDVHYMKNQNDPNKNQILKFNKHKTEMTNHELKKNKIKFESEANELGIHSNLNQL